MTTSTGDDGKQPAQPGDITTYEIGYRKPPRATQFKKGQSGNPKGRPKGSRSVKALLEDALARTVTITESGQPSRISKREALVLALITRAIKGRQRGCGTGVSPVGGS